MSLPLRVALILSLACSGVPALAAFPSEVEGWTITRRGDICRAGIQDVWLESRPFDGTQIYIGLSNSSALLGGSMRKAYAFGAGEAEYSGFVLKEGAKPRAGDVSLLMRSSKSAPDAILQGRVPDNSVLDELQRSPRMLAAPEGTHQATIEIPVSAAPVSAAMVGALKQCLSDASQPNRPVELARKPLKLDIFDQAGQLPSGAVLAPSSFTLEVHGDSRVRSCIVQKSTGYAAADRLICADMQNTTGRFYPATDREGRAVTANYTLEVPRIAMP
ncbi:hypothetical protein SZ64_02935 [Erythrobacter sp. SG61-1L]|uniref:hypothetical protein n=1 Tax=Erythrobacter sp. SG61-1L TaxID=1603897 RepID=UPI0006C909C8|nr:hypothetical protein [Erythrobacter sp. SG61-1L]KPL67142.1 hypothetical protein SZ64_02935 [Erythrobacter sp. SG61-1L]